MKKPVTVTKEKARVGFLVLKDPPDYCAFYFDPNHSAYGTYEYNCEAFRLTGGNKGIGYFRLEHGSGGWMHGSGVPSMAEQNKNYNFYPDLATATANLPDSMSATEKALFASYQDLPNIVIAPARPNPSQTDWSKVDLYAIIEERWKTGVKYPVLADKYGFSALTLRSKISDLQCSDAWIRMIRDWKHSPDAFYQNEWAKVKDTYQGQIVEKYNP